MSESDKEAADAEGKGLKRGSVEGKSQVWEGWKEISSFCVKLGSL